MWYSVHTNSVALCEMAQRNVEWYSVDTNSVALGRIALQNIRRYIWTLNCLVLLKIFRCCGESSSLLVAWREGHAIPLLAMLSCSWSLSHLCICWSIRHPCIFGGDGRQGISPKPPKIQTANGTAICWGHDVIECEDWHETITWRSIVFTSLCRKAEPIR